MQNFGKVAVLMGGFSSEREISLTSGNAILKALREKGVDAHAFDPKETPLSELKTQGFQAAFNILHGTYGEDGTVQGALEALGILYTGCGVLASALGMDKYRCKLIWAALGLPIPPFVVLHDDSDFAAVEALLGLPMFVKPAAEGSSVGVYKITQKANWRKFISSCATKTCTAKFWQNNSCRAANTLVACSIKLRCRLSALSRKMIFTIGKPNICVMTRFTCAHLI